MPGPDWSLEANLFAFVCAALVIGLAGTRLAADADHLADRTGLGEALMGGLFLGVSTSLPGITASMTAAWDGYAPLAISNAVGGIAVQTAFLAVADIFYRRANLEHAAASLPNVIQSTLLILLLATLMGIITGPEIMLGHVHLGTPLLILVYLLGYQLVRKTRAEPMWLPTQTVATVEDVPDTVSDGRSMTGMWLSFAAAAAVIMVSGMVIARSAEGLVQQLHVSESVMGGLFTAISTSLPELVTTVAAVRRGALTLAVGDIVGGNAFDVLFVCLADGVYLPGSIYARAGPHELFLVTLAVILNVILLMGLIQRQRRGFANIGFESVTILVVYIGAVLLLAFGW